MQTKEIENAGVENGFEYPPLTDVARRYLAAYREIEDRIERSPAEVIRELVSRAEKEPFKLYPTGPSSR